jgi:hypothetical protein
MRLFKFNFNIFFALRYRTCPNQLNYILNNYVKIITLLENHKHVEGNQFHKYHYALPL